MKRNWDIIERILSQLESDIDINDIINNEEITRETYHLLTDDKFIYADNNSEFPVARLTMKGHDLLSYLRFTKSQNTDYFKINNLPKTFKMMEIYSIKELKL